MKIIINGFIPAGVYAGFASIPVLMSYQQQLSNFITRESEVCTTSL
ncbi:MAG: hypothetical protein JOZ02_13205 [Acidobacteria bacterium]|nr:hypothetical protein [Acidobacteriota bacterium]